MRKYLIIILLTSVSLAQGQTVPIGSWQSHFPYNSATAIAGAGNVMYGGKYGLLEYHILTNEIETYTKVNGLSDVNISHLAWDPTSQTLLITYQNSNIDLLKDKRVVNIPDLKNANIVASKSINSINLIDNNFYFSTGLGILIVDPIRKEIKESYPMIIAGEQAIVYDVQQFADSFTALTNKGIYKANVNSTNLKDISQWRLASVGAYSKLCIADNNLFLISDKKLFQWDGVNTVTPIYTTALQFTDILYAKNRLYCSTFDGYGQIIRYHVASGIIDTINGMSPLDLAVDANDNVWAANTFSGLTQLVNDNAQQVYTVNGPQNINSFNLKIIDKDLYVTSGGIDNIGGYNAVDKREGFYKLSNNTWTNYNQYVGPIALDTIKGIMDIEIDPKTKSLYATSFGGGFMELKTNGEITVKKNDNEITGIATNANLCSYMHYDDDGNLWQTISNTGKNLVVKKRDGSWQTFNIPISGDYKVIGDFVIDNANQLWIIIPRSKGVMVFSHNNTIDNINDDNYKMYLAGASTGNLASNQVISIAKDKDGKIWLGTDNGISIINCPESAFDVEGCSADNKIVQYDAFAGPLFKEQSVYGLAVDGANRKWVGTSNGLWLISPDADSIRQRFTKANSPLPADEITDIAVSPITGEVFIGTISGLVSYRGTATDGSTTSTEPLVFPNPVPANYSGVIAIKGFVDNADVQIIDASGKLIYKTKALGGQAIWNGRTYTGEKPNSGVFFVLASNADGSKRQQTKFVFMQ